MSISLNDAVEKLGLALVPIRPTQQGAIPPLSIASNLPFAHELVIMSNFHAHHVVSHTS